VIQCIGVGNDSSCHLFTTRKLVFSALDWATVSQKCGTPEWACTRLTRCLVTGTRKFNCGLKQLIVLSSRLHRLSASEPIKYVRVSLSGWNYPRYLATHCTPVSATASRHHLRSAASHQFVVPSYRLSSYGRRAFSVAVPMTWNSPSRHLRGPIHTSSVCGRLIGVIHCRLCPNVLISWLWSTRWSTEEWCCRPIQTRATFR